MLHSKIVLNSAPRSSSARKPLAPLASTSGFLKGTAPYVLSVQRIIVGLLFLEHGTQKLLGFPPATHPGPALFSLLGVQGAIELVGGALIVAGLFTRGIAFILAGDMAVAYFMSHVQRAFFPILNGGDAAILYCFVFLYFVFAGGGAWSADNVLHKKREASVSSAA